MSESELESEHCCMSKESWEIFSFLSQHCHHHMSENMAETQIPMQTPTPKQTQGAETTSVARSKEEEQWMRQDEVLVRVMGLLDMVLGKQ